MPSNLARKIVKLRAEASEKLLNAEVYADAGNIKDAIAETKKALPILEELAKLEE